MNDAMEQVRHIVNQPVRHIKRTDDMLFVGTYPYWFHVGAQKPDFLNADVRRTQEFIYDNNPYVTSQLNPGEVFASNELEFNRLTKYFYTDYGTPKKRLTEAEMEEVNRLYHVIGHCEQQLDDLQHPEPMWAVAHRWAHTHRPAVIGIIAVLLAALAFLRKRRVRRGNT